MKALDSAICTEKGKDSVAWFWLLKISTDYRYTNAAETLTVGGAQYVPMPMRLEGFQQSSGRPSDGGQIALGNLPTPPATEPVMASLVLNNLITDATVEVSKAWCSFLSSSALSVIGVEPVFSGRVNGRPALGEEWCTLYVVPNKNIVAARLGRRLGRTCAWRFFKDADCGYSGGIATCARTWEDCVARHGSDAAAGAKFGGQRWLPAAGTKAVWGITTITWR